MKQKVKNSRAVSKTKKSHSSFKKKKIPAHLADDQKRISSKEPRKTISGGNSLVSDQSVVQEIISLDHFLIDEQINYADNPKEQAKRLKEKLQPIIKELDQLIAGKKSETSFQEVLPQNQINVSLNKNGGVEIKKSSGYTSSVHRVDLRQDEPVALNQTSAWRPAFNKPPSVTGRDRPGFKKYEPATDLDEFKVRQTNFDIPKTSYLKKEKLTGWIAKKFSSIKFHRIVKKNNQPAPLVAGRSWPQSLRTTLNFALIALLLILPIRVLFFYQYVETTKGQVLGISEDALGDLELGAQAASQSNWLDAGNYFLSASKYFGSAQDNLSAYNQTLINIARHLPAAGSIIKSGENLLVAGEHLTKAAGDLTTVLSQISESGQLDRAMTDNIAIIDGAVTSAQKEISLAAESIATVNPKVIPEQYRDYFVQIQSRLPQFSSGLLEVEKFLSLSLDILGHNRPQRYLFLFQNNNELRATGGFLGSAALVDIQKGKIVNLEVPGGGLYDSKGSFFEKVISPAPMHLVGTPWMIWDANWWPDFPASAQKIIWFWENSGGPTVDGVITFNASLLPKLLEITGDITMPEYDQVLTSDNVVLALQHEVEFEYDKAANQPKKIIAELMPIIIEKLLATPTDRALPLLLTLEQALTEKEIQFYFLNEDLEKQVSQRRWSGEIIKTDGDYLMVVNQNVAGGKSDMVIKQEIKHYAYIQPDGSIINTVAVTRTHHGNPDDVFERAQNNSYVRIYVPQDSQLLEVTGYDTIDASLFKEVYQGYRPDEDVLRISGTITKDAKTNTDIYSEFGKTVFGNWLQVKPGESKTITFSYRLPLKLDFTGDGLFKKSQSQKYSLLVQSQSGAQNTVFSSQLYLTDDLEVTWSQATATGQPVILDNEVKFEIALNSDNFYGLIIRKK